MLALVLMTGSRFVLAAAEHGVVQACWNNALALHRREHELMRWLQMAERAWQLEQSVENADRIAELKMLQGQRLEMDSS